MAKCPALDALWRSSLDLAGSLERRRGDGEGGEKAGRGRQMMVLH